MKFFPSSSYVDSAIWMLYTDANLNGEKAWRQLHGNAARNIEQVLEAAPHKNSSSTATYYPSRKLSKLDETDMQDTDREVRTNS